MTHFYDPVVRVTGDSAMRLIRTLKHYVFFLAALLRHVATKERNCQTEAGPHCICSKALRVFFTRLSHCGSWKRHNMER